MDILKFLEREYTLLIERSEDEKYSNKCRYEDEINAEHLKVIIDGIKYTQLKEEKEELTKNGGEWVKFYRSTLQTIRPILRENDILQDIKDIKKYLLHDNNYCSHQHPVSLQKIQAILAKWTTEYLNDACDDLKKAE